MLCALAVLMLTATPAHAGGERGRAPGALPSAGPARLGAGDALGQLMFGRTLHRRHIMRERSLLHDSSPEHAPFDPQAWLERQARKPGRR